MSAFPKIIQERGEDVYRIGVFACKGGSYPEPNVKPCGSVLEIYRRNLYWSCRSYMDFSQNYFATFQCPKCGHGTVITNLGLNPYQDLPSYDTWVKSLQT